MSLFWIDLTLTLNRASNLALSRLFKQKWGTIIFNDYTGDVQ